jgi:hypothetical protein
MKFTKSLTSDSTDVTIEWGGGSPGEGDTTGTLDLRRYNVVNWANADDMEYLRLLVFFSGADNSANSATTDTIQLISMYSFDGTYWAEESALTAPGPSTAIFEVATQRAASAEAGLGAPFWRFIITHWTEGATDSRQVWVRPIIYVAK